MKELLKTIGWGFIVSIAFLIIFTGIILYFKYVLEPILQLWRIYVSNWQEVEYEGWNKKMAYLWRVG